MKIALFGHGTMNRLVRERAEAEGHEIGLVVTSRAHENARGYIDHPLEGHDVAVDFSVPGAVVGTVEACARARVPLVEGTTGWGDEFHEVRRVVLDLDAACVFGANFSPGANVLFRLADRAAELFAAIGDYDPYVEEAHHARKKDAPSGTALRLCEIVEQRWGRGVPVTSTRAGHIPGTHRVGFDSSSDDITLTHTARSRDGFAAGALLAARWVIGKRGFFPFSEVVDDILAERKNQPWRENSIGYAGAPRRS